MFSVLGVVCVCFGILVTNTYKMGGREKFAKYVHNAFLVQHESIYIVQRTTKWVYFLVHRLCAALSLSLSLTISFSTGWSLL